MTLSLDCFLAEFNIRLKDFYSRLYPGDERLHQACRYAMEGVGKQVRPSLAFLSCQALGAFPDEVFAPAITIEMIHTYSLIHDDLPCFDNDPVRRGRPTLHVRYDQQTALLAGDTLLTDSWLALSGEDSLTEARCRKRLAMIREIAGAAGGQGMASGQMLDSYWTCRSGYTEEDLRTIDLRKTAALMGAACAVGAMAATDCQSRIAALRSFGQSLGMAFQIRDDILDARTGTGKSQGKDVRQGKLTWLRLMSEEEAEERAAQLTRTAMDQLLSAGGCFDELFAYSDRLLGRSF